MLLKLIRSSLAWSLIVFLCLAALALLLRIPAVILFIYICFAIFLSYRLKDGWFIVFLFLSAFLIRFLYMNLIDTPIVSDFRTLYDAAVLFSKGDYSFSQSPYFTTWGYQTAFVIYEGSIIKILGEPTGIYVLRILNCLWNTGLTLLIYLTARNYFKEKSARIASILYMGLVFPITFVTVLSNQHISAFLIVLGIFLMSDKCLIKLGLIFRALLGGFFIALGNIIRPEGVIIFASLFIFFLILFTKADRKKRLNVTASALVLAAVYLAVNISASGMVISNGINKSGLNNNNFYWKFVVGLNPKSNGTYNAQDVSLIYESKLSKSEQESLEIELIRERLSAGPIKLGQLFINKVQNLWCENAMFWSYSHLLGSGKTLDLLGNKVNFNEIDSILRDLQEMSNLLIMILCLFGLIAKKRTDYSDSLIIYIAVLLVSFTVYLFIEVQARYVYLPEVFLFILGCMGLDALSDRFNASGMRSAFKNFLPSKTIRGTK